MSVSEEEGKAEKPRLKTLAILLGERNNVAGELTCIAKSRCDELCKELAGKSDYRILPTGSFGRHFNETDRPHGDYLSDYLVEKRIGRENILPYTRSSNTIEDLFAARKVAVDLDPHEVIVVTSDFHMTRVQYIGRRILVGLPVPVRYVCAETRSDDKKREEELREKEKLQEAKRVWVDVPLYRKGVDFPGTIYQEALAELRHYDNLSYAVVSASLALFGFFLFADIESDNAYRVLDDIYRITDSLYNIFIRLIQTVTMFAAWMLYERLAWFGRIARQVATRVEIGFGVPAFSVNHAREAKPLSSVELLRHPKETFTRAREEVLQGKGLPVRFVVNIVYAFMFCISLIMFGISLISLASV